MVAPEGDFPVRPEHPSGRAFFASSQPALTAATLLGEWRSSLALRSVAAMVFGFAFLWPAISDATLIRLFAAYAFVDGILALAPGGWGLSYRLGWPLLIGGCIDLVGAGAAYLWPGMTLPALLDITAVWAIASAFAFTLAYAALRDADDDQRLLLGGIAALLFGRALLSQIPIDVIVLSAWMGLYALTMSVLFLKLTLKHYRLPLL